MGSEGTIAANPSANQQAYFEYPIRSFQIFQTSLIHIRNISPANGKVFPGCQKIWGSYSSSPEWPALTGRQRKYIGGSFIMNIQISRIPVALQERLLTVRFGLLQILIPEDAYVVSRVICKYFCLNSDTQVFRNLQTGGYTSYTPSTYPGYAA